MCLALRQAVQHREIEPCNTTGFAPEVPLQTNNKAVFNGLLCFRNRKKALPEEGTFAALCLKIRLENKTSGNRQYQAGVTVRAYEGSIADARRWRLCLPRGLRDPVQDGAAP